MKVLHVISSGGMYGAEAVILNLSRAMNETGHRSLVASFANEPVPNLQLHERALGEGLESYLIPCSGQFDRGVTGRIRELVAQHGVDLVHSHGYKADVFAWLALRGTGVPYVSTCHNWISSDWRAQMYGIVDRHVLRYYDAVVAVSVDVQRRLLGAGVERKRVSIIRNGINLQPFVLAVRVTRPVVDGKIVAKVGLAGRLSPEKGADIFLRAAALVLVALPNVRFVIAGDGPERDALEELASQLGIHDCVEMLGRVEAIAEFYASLDVLVSSSRYEGLPMGLLEAMASGCAIVATPVGEVPSAIVDGQTGVMVPVGDVGELANAIMSLLRDPPKRLELGLAARAHAQAEFSAGRMAEDYVRLYESVCRGGEPLAGALRKDEGAR